MLGNETTLRLFDGTVTREVEEMAAAVSVATVRDGTDEITFVAIYPRSVDDGASVERLLDGIEH
jgi:hypothetical protein